MDVGKLKVCSRCFIPLSLTTVQTTKTKQMFHSITPVLFPFTVCITSHCDKNSFLVKYVMKTTHHSSSKEGQIDGTCPNILLVFRYKSCGQENMGVLVS